MLCVQIKIFSKNENRFMYLPSPMTFLNENVFHCCWLNRETSTKTTKKNRTEQNKNEQQYLIVNIFLHMVHRTVAICCPFAYANVFFFHCLRISISPPSVLKWTHQKPIRAIINIALRLNVQQPTHKIKCFNFIWSLLQEIEYAYVCVCVC